MIILQDILHVWFRFGAEKNSSTGEDGANDSVETRGAVRDHRGTFHDSKYVSHGRMNVGPDASYS